MFANTELYAPNIPFELKVWVAKSIAVIGSLLNLLVFVFLLTFPNDKIVIRKKYLYLLIGITGFLCIGGFFGLIFSNIVIKNGVITPTPGILISVFLIHTLFLILGGLVFYFMRYRKKRGPDRTRMFFLLLGVIVLFSLIIIFNFIFPTFFKIGYFVPLLPVYILIFNLIVAYAVIRHKLLDIRVIVARSVAYTLIVVILGGFYAFYLTFVGAILFRIPFSSAQFIFYGVIMFIVAFTFQPLRNELEFLTDTILYQGHYDSEKLLKKLSEVMSQTIILETLTVKILEIVLHDMKITRGIFILLKKNDHGRIDYVESRGYDAEPYFTPEAVNKLIDYKPMIIFDYMEEGEIKELLRGRNITVVLPLLEQNEKTGILCLGEKLSGGIFQDQDVNLLSILAPQLSVAIQNAKEYDEIKRFNITLREEVDLATKELQLANDKLKDLDKLKDEFVSLASHELRTPLTAIKSYLWLLLRQGSEIGQLNEKQMHYMQQTYLSTERLIKLVHDMLNVSRIESGRLIINTKPTNLEHLSREVISEILPTVQSENLDLSLLASDRLIPLVIADPDKIKEVLINLIGNAIKFTPPGGKITITFSQQGNTIITSVTDTGSGIKHEDISKLFNKFGQIQSSYANNPTATGTGLGLYIAKSIITLHGGTMWVNSEGENKGSTFSFSLNRADTA